MVNQDLNILSLVAIAWHFTHIIKTMSGGSDDMMLSDDMMMSSLSSGGMLVADWTGHWWCEQSGVSSEAGQENIVILISRHTTQLSTAVSLAVTSGWAPILQTSTIANQLIYEEKMKRLYSPLDRKPEI